MIMVKFVTRFSYSSLGFGLFSFTVEIWEFGNKVKITLFFQIFFDTKVYS